MNNVVQFASLCRVAPEWYRAQCEPHSGELTVAQQVVLMALDFGMPSVLQGDADGACFVLNLEGRNCPEGLAGTTGLEVLWVTENLELTIVPIAGTGEAKPITYEHLLANYAVVPVGAGLEEWLAWVA